MKAVIIEDEQFASKRLHQQINEIGLDLEVIAILDSVESAKKWFGNNEVPDLVFLDIQLNDGYGFDVLEALKKQPPVIFTTAYNEYALRGFKFNGVDYLLKPIDKNELKIALEKFLQTKAVDTTPKVDVLKNFFKKEYKHRFMVKVGNHFSTFNVSDIAFFKSEDGKICLYTAAGKSYPIEYSIDQLVDILNPVEYFRVNRKYLVSLRSVQQIHNYFNSRLLLKLLPNREDKVIVSRERVSDFKKWLDL